MATIELALWQDFGFGLILMAMVLVTAGLLARRVEADAIR